MKSFTIILTLLGALFSTCWGQCCNVLSSNGTAITSSGGSCVSLTHQTSDCLTASSQSVSSASDLDHDSVADELDACPTIKGTKENKGCPEVSHEVWTQFYTELKDVRFENNSDEFIAISQDKLNKVVSLMKTHENYKLKISGYADSVGTQESNKILSGKRATAVKRYLESKGIDGNRLKLAAYGEKFPKATNETIAGRSVNRRVEFDLFY